MQPKKSPRADLENKRGMFFLFGLSVALLASILIIQIESSANTTDEFSKQDKATTLEEDVPITYINKPKPEVKEHKPSNDKIALVDEIITKPQLPMHNIEVSDSVVEIVDEPMPVEVVETIEHFMVQKLAVPPGCENYQSREEQMDCLNLWINQYIVKHLNLEKVRNPFGDDSRVYVNFTISELGEVKNVKIVKESYYTLDREVVKILNEMPDFRPASQYGRKVRMSMTIPLNVKFR